MKATGTMEPEQKTNPGFALVLGGGGLLGAAWEAGLIAGIAEEEAGITIADRIIGTSAGAIIGLQIALGRSPEDIFQGQIAMADEYRKHNPVPPESSPSPARQPQIIQDILKAALEGDVPRELLAKIGSMALESPALPEEPFVARFQPLLKPGERWPDRFVCIALDAEDGALAVWDKDSRVDPVRAIAASAAAPFVVTPIRILGHRYMDAGIRSTTNADIAKGSDRVVVVAPSAAFMPELIIQAKREVAAIEEAGGKAILITPDRTSTEAMGFNPMDAARSGAVARAAFKQAGAEMGELKKFL
jgi:NTE family protein